MPPDLTLRAVTAADLPVMAARLATGALRDWWGDPAQKRALVTKDLAHPLLDQQIACPVGRPFGGGQSCPCAAWGMPQ